MLAEDAADKRVQWSNSDNAIATIDDNSTVTAISEGAATITVTNVDRSNTAYGFVPEASAAAQHTRFRHLDELLHHRRHAPRACRLQSGLRSRHGLAGYFHVYYQDEPPDTPYYRSVATGNGSRRDELLYALHRRKPAATEISRI